ncbi:MAG: phosphomethylpyrimidine synthase ThiC, partial [Methanobacteriaceae archaeon]|nr:phosphomethylpyrimidine synthase ThiC [Methanobacteriaceae archaeon]
MTQMDEAKKGMITEEMKAVAAQENVSEEFIRKS